MQKKRLIPLITALKTAIIVMVVAYILNLQNTLKIAIFSEQMIAAVLACALALAFLLFPLSRKEVGEEALAKAALGKIDADEHVGIIDLALSFVAFVCCMYIAINYQDLIKQLVDRPLWGVILCSLVVICVFEASRRVAGSALIIIVLLLCAHALFGYMLPEMFASRPISLSRLVVYLGIDTNSLLGNTLQTAIVVVTPFIIMGAILTKAGGSDFFADFANALMGRYRGGSAKVAVVGSAFFGMVSGSAVANVASVGTITIPMMKRAGFPPHVAASVEAVGSTGGQIAPPVMGAAAFLMAEYLQIPYFDVVVAATIPAFLFYAALFIQVDLESVKYGVLGSPKENLPQALKVLKEGWHFVFPFVVLVVGMLKFNMEAEVAALLATATLLVLSLIFSYNGKKLTPKTALTAGINAGGSVVDIIAITAIAGILIGAMTLTGVTFSLTQQLISASGGNLIALLVLTALASFLLGLPLPTVGVYVILATLAAPALVTAGISPIQAHLFVLFSGILGMVTPPVALASFAAATIAESDQWKTGWTSTRMSWCAYFIPFMFAFSPELVMKGSFLSIITVLFFTLLGIWFGSVAVLGFYKHPVTWLNRAYCLATALLLLTPKSLSSQSLVFNLIGLLLGALFIYTNLNKGK